MFLRRVGVSKADARTGRVPFKIVHKSVTGLVLSRSDAAGL
jgi:hypothetical protein